MITMQSLRERRHDIMRRIARSSLTFAGAIVLVVACSDPQAAKAQPKPKAEEVVYRVGGDVRPPVVIRRSEPRIPPGAKCRGLVLLEAVIDSHGRPTKIRDLSPSPDALTQACSIALADWRFRPATRSGRPVAVWFSVTVTPHCL